MPVTKAADSPYVNTPVIKTGFSNLDKILGGGVPFRRITEISGLPSNGKSTLALHIVARAQQEGLDCLWADSELSYESGYSIALGVDQKKLDLSIERHAEELLDSIEEWAKSHKNGLIVLDSVGELAPREEQEKKSGERSIGLQARLMAQFVRKIKPYLMLNNLALVCLNHEHTDLMSGKIITSGGRKLEHGKSIWIRLKQKQGVVLKSGEKRVGKVIVAECKKNKLASTEGQSCDLQLIFGSGFNAQADQFEDELESGRITKVGNTFFRDGEKLGVGKTKAMEALKDALNEV